MKYKETRVNWFYGVLVPILDRYQISKETIQKMKRFLLATISKEEQSQKIMMEQVDKPFTKKDYNKLQKDLDNMAGHEPTGIFANKQDKPVCEHIFNKVEIVPGDFNKLFCSICGEQLSPPIEDTNKTRLEVPNTISEDFNCSNEYLVIKYNELIGFNKKLLTLISLDKK